MVEEDNKVVEQMEFNELQAAFTDYINEFKKLSIVEKKKESIDSIKELIAVIDSFAKNNDIELHYLSSNEILDVAGDKMEEKDYVEAMLVYIEVAKNLLGEVITSLVEK